MIKSLLLSGPGLALLAGLALSAVAFLVRKSVLWLSANPKTAPLAPLAADVGTLLSDEVKTLKDDLTAGKSEAAVLKDLLAKAAADARADIPDAEQAVKGEVSVLLNGAPSLTQTTPGGVTVNMPSPIDPKAAQRGLAPLVVLLIVGGVALAGAVGTLFATGNGGQALSCVEKAANANPASFGSLVTALSTGNAQQGAEAAVIAFGPELAQCVLTDLWDDAKAELAQKAAAKANAAVVAPAQVLKAAAQAECVRRGLYPAGTVK